MTAINPTLFTASSRQLVNTVERNHEALASEALASEALASEALPSDENSQIIDACPDGLVPMSQIGIFR